MSARVGMGCKPAKFNTAQRLGGCAKALGGCAKGQCPHTHTERQRRQVSKRASRFHIGHGRNGVRSGHCPLLQAKCE
eukprot:4624049-Pyramimonas_sp.AAC.1